MRASRVGVHTINAEWTEGARHVPCIRCGYVRIANGKRRVEPLCRDCRSVDPHWGEVPFEDLPVDDSNACSFEDEYVSSDALRKRRARQRNREEQ